MHEINKNVPIPPPSRGPGASSKYPFAKMEVGDSFLADVSPSKVSSSARAWAKRKGGRFVTRIEGDHVRVWRVA